MDEASDNDAGGHREVEIPVPIPNTEVKHPCADDTANRGKVGDCRLFFILNRNMQAADVCSAAILVFAVTH